MSKKVLGVGVLVALVCILALVYHIANDHVSDVEHHKAPLGGASPDKERKPGFVTRCKFRYHAPVDPIVVPGTVGVSHLHAFFGGEVNKDSTRRTLMAGDTSCNTSADKSGYWDPAFRKKTANGSWQTIEPLAVFVYYRIGDGVEPASVVLIPKGQQFVAGNKDAARPQEIVTFSCSGPGAQESESGGNLPVNCTGEAPFPVARIIGPDCTNGQPVSGDDRSHTDYSTNGRCPDGFKPTVRVRMDFRFPEGTDVSGAKLSSGSPYGFHADFMEAWDREALQRLTNKCVRDGSGCSIQETAEIAAQARGG